MAQGTETLGMQYQNADSYGCDGSPSFRFAWSWGVLADMYGNWNASNSTTLYATYEHVHTQTNWQWSFTYGPPSASPTPTTYADTFIAPTTTYRY